MEKIVKLRPVEISDSDFLLSWRNHTSTRKNSFNTQKVSNVEHINYLNDIFKSSIKNLFVLLFNEKPVGTIREYNFESNKFNLSYTINPENRGQKLGQLMMSIYLLNKKGTFYCEVKKSNKPSIAMIKKIGFKYFKRKDDIYFYKLIK